MVAGACNPSYSGGWGGRIAWPRRWRLQWAEIVTLHSSLDKSETATQKKKWGLGSLLMPVIPALWEAEVVRWVDHLKVRSSRPPWPTCQNHISTKNTKISWAWWLIPIISATWEAEVGELLEPGPRRQRLQWAEIMPLHSSLGDRARLCLKKQNKTLH